MLHFHDLTLIVGKLTIYAQLQILAPNRENQSVINMIQELL